MTNAGSFQRNLPLRASEIATLWNICFANVKYSLAQMWANFISHCDKGAIFHNGHRSLFHIRRICMVIDKYRQITYHTFRGNPPFTVCRSLRSGSPPAWDLSTANGVRLKRRLPAIPQVRNGGMCIALREIFPGGGDTYRASKSVLDCINHFSYCELGWKIHQ